MNSLQIFPNALWKMQLWLVAAFWVRQLSISKQLPEKLSTESQGVSTKRREYIETPLVAWFLDHEFVFEWILWPFNLMCSLRSNRVRNYVDRYRTESFYCSGCSQLITQHLITGYCCNENAAPRSWFFNCFWLLMSPSTICFLGGYTFIVHP